MEYTRGIAMAALVAMVSFLVVSHVNCGPLDRAKSHSIQKRTILQMCGLITLHTNRSCLEYNGYGCFCGLGNQGRKPLDDVDTCCRKHDNCYGEVSCFWFYPQWVGYGVQCDGSNCRCTDSPVHNACAYTTCRCDLRLAECLGEADFHGYYQRYNRQLCNHRVENDPDD
ncbi:acidic phospholipase A2-like [Haliotis rufescens]|uniref:acidic phospholipase A2-like n=1 Tax=Haliotis rufescens TaxID=6454 RepID=UPI001EAF93BF|nr:acidic phospholipase A2-like [Haliotis rufescens]